MCNSPWNRRMSGLGILIKTKMIRNILDLNYWWPYYWPGDSNCKNNNILLSNLNPSWNVRVPGRGNWQFLSEEQLWLFQVSERCLLDVYKDNPVTRKVKSKYELNEQQDSLKFNACKSSENSERIGEWWRKNFTDVKFSYSTWERKQLRSVVRASSGITACQTLLPVLVIQQDLWYCFHWHVAWPWAKEGELNGSPGRLWWNGQSCKGFNDQPVCVMQLLITKWAAETH